MKGKIKEFFELNPSQNTNKYKDFINYIDTASVENGILNDIEFLSCNFPSRAQRIVKYDDILYSTVRPNLRHYYHYRKNYDHLVASTGFVLIRNKNAENYSTRFLFYYLSSNSVVKHLSNIAELSQSTFPSFSPKDLGKIDLPELTIEKQTKIASILSAYDDLIENNNKRIKILEQMAENLYKEWFVRFRFPGYENALVKDSLLGKIPQSFNVLKMKHIIDYYIGGGWGEDEQKQGFPCGAYVIRGTDFSNIKNGEWMQCPYRYHKKSNYMARKLSPWDIIIEISGGTQEQPVGRTLIVTPDLLEKLGDTVICASFCKQVRCNNEIISPSYFYYWMQYLYRTRVIDKFQSQTTGIINFKFEYFLRKGDVLMPPKDLMDKFEKYIKTIYKMKDKLAIKNQNLIKQRDLLLPRLMSGKLEV